MVALVVVVVGGLTQGLVGLAKTGLGGRSVAGDRSFVFSLTWGRGEQQLAYVVLYKEELERLCNPHSCAIFVEWKVLIKIFQYILQSAIVLS